LSQQPKPTDLFAAAPEVGAAPLVLGRETGFALKLLAPPLEESSVRPEPPGQGQLLIGLTGRAQVDEVGGAEGRVVSTTRIPRGAPIGPGQLFRVANDARWTLNSLEPGTLLVALSTSVPRENQRTTDVLASASRRSHLGAVRVFGNEVVWVDYVAARGRLPLRGFTPWARKTQGVEYFLGLQGAFRIALSSESEPSVSHSLGVVQLLRLDPGVSLRLRADNGKPSVGLVITGRAASIGGPVRREDARGFSPFG